MSSERLSPATSWASRYSTNYDSVFWLVCRLLGASLAIVLAFFWGFCAIATIVYIAFRHDESLAALRDFVFPDVAILALAGIPVGLFYGVVNWLLLMKRLRSRNVSLSAFVDMPGQDRCDVLFE